LNSHSTRHHAASALVQLNIGTAFQWDVTVDIIEEQSFRDRYSRQLQSLRGYRELEEELQQVCHQSVRTPGRRGEEIKLEELGAELVRRHHHRQ
jgi:hypothetical protein